jgi:hypothetical protein
MNNNREQDNQFFNVPDPTINEDQHHYSTAIIPPYYEEYNDSLQYSLQQQTDSPTASFDTRTTSTAVPPPIPQHLLIQKRAIAHPYIETHEFSPSYHEDNILASPDDNTIREYMDDHLIQQEQDANVLEEPMWDCPDPNSSKLFIVNWFRGFCFPLKALVMCFKGGYIWIALCESIVIGLLLLLTIGIGSVSGFFTVRGIWKIPKDRTWYFLWKFLPYNYFAMWITLTVLVCLFFSGILFMIGFIPFRAILDTACKRLSIIAEKRMKLEEFKPKNQAAAQLSDEEKVPDMFSVDWFVDYGKSYLDGVVNGFFNQFRAIIRRTTKRLLIRAITFVLMNVLGLFLGVIIPGAGLVLSLITFFITSSLNAALVGLDVVFDRKEYRLLEAQRTIWNNFWVIVGHGSGLLLVGFIPGAIFLMFPVTVISSTRLLTQLEIHKRTGKNDEFWDIPCSPLCVSFHYMNPYYVSVISKDRRDIESHREPDIVDLVL